MEIGNYFHATKLNFTTVANKKEEKLKKQRKSFDFFSEWKVEKKLQD